MDIESKKKKNAFWTFIEDRVRIVFPVVSQV